MADLKMPDVNMVMIAGNLTSDPSFRRTTNGTPVANFYIASNRRFKDNTGQWRENVCYVGIVAWYKLAESCHQNLQKGSAVLIDGELQSRAWKNEDGSSKNVVELKARRIQFLNKRKSDDSSDDNAEDDYHLDIPYEYSDSDHVNDNDDERNKDDLNFGYEDLTF